MDPFELFELKKERATVFWHVTNTTLDDFLISPDNIQYIFHFYRFQTIFWEKINHYNKTLRVEENLIDYLWEILYITLDILQAKTMFHSTFIIIPFTLNQQFY